MKNARTGKRFRAGVIVLALAPFFLAACGATGDGEQEFRQGKEESNDIRLVVDGKLRKVWTVSDLMSGRFDWKSPKQKVYPAVPVSFVLYSEGSGLSRDAIATVRLMSSKGALEVSGKNLSLVDDLLLKLDVGRGGIWSLVGRSREAERRIAALSGERRLKKLETIEVVLKKDLTGGGPAGSGDTAASAVGAKDIILATTTSTQDSGLLDVLVPLFEKKTGHRVKTIAVGTGEALAMGKRGDADVVLAHAPELEKKSVASGFTINRRLVMHNDFVIVGPPDDPARIGGMKKAGTAFRRIAEAEARFASRGDNSGTHFLEKKLWKEAGVEPAGAWYIEAGQGMGATLLIASEKGAYSLTDRGTFLALKKRAGLGPMVEGDGVLLNIYSVMEVNPARFPKANHKGARAFGDFLVSAEAQAVIETFGVEKFGQPLFFPDAGKSEDGLGG